MSKYCKIGTIIMVPLLMSSALIGCTAKKPIPVNPPRTITTPNTVYRVPTAPMTPITRPAPATTAQARDAAADISTKVAKISGVNKSYVVVVGNVALIGLDIKKDVQGSKVTAIKKEAAKIARQDTRIVSATVAEDADTVTRIRNISTGIGKGRPISEFFKQINEIFTRVQPTT
ncbi:MAG TPA: YhcN/YlaJ family sporulation lipoprotein [Bacillota bacterium]|nr:YhcN/YlaJ family sporulation lipoprotein [Bacillota bacterium]